MFYVEYVLRTQFAHVLYAILAMKRLWLSLYLCPTGWRSERSAGIAGILIGVWAGPLVHRRELERQLGCCPVTGTYRLRGSRCEMVRCSNLFRS